MDYTHLPLGEDIQALAGHYTPLKEERLQYRGRPVLYVLGAAAVTSSCCGCANFDYALVPGYVTRWQSTKNGKGFPVSEVEPIHDRPSQEELTKIIREAEGISAVQFW